MKVTVPLLLALVSLALATHTHAETIYQWADENGVTQFTAQPPQGREYRRVQARTGHSEPVSYSQTEADEEQTPRGAADTVGPSQEELDQACRVAIQNLETLERGGRIAVEDDNGDRRYLDEDELAERAEEARQMQEQAC